MSIRYERLDHAVVWSRYAQGQLPAQIGRSMGRPPDAIYALIYKAGGIKPTARIRCAGHLSLAEREEISRGIAAGGVRRAGRSRRDWAGHPRRSLGRSPVTAAVRATGRWLPIGRHGRLRNGPRRASS